MASGTNSTTKKRTKFLEVLRQTGNISKACEVISLSRRTAYNWRAQDAEFAELWDDAIEAGYDLLEQEARRRAYRGLVKKKFGKDGDPVIDPATGQQYYEREYSDTLLIFLLKGGRPEKYRENIKQEQSGEIRIKVQYGNDGSERAND